MPKQKKYLAKKFWFFLFLIINIFSQLVLAQQNPEWLSFNTKNSRLPDDEIYCVKIDAFDNLWVATQHGGLVKFDGTYWTIYDTTNSQIPSNMVNSLTIDKYGNKWAATSKGLAEFDGNVWTIYNSKNSGLCFDVVLVIGIDLSGNKWIGTSYGGLSKFDGTHWTSYHSYDSGIQIDCVMSIGIDNVGRKWFGTDYNGLYLYDDFGWMSFLKQRTITSIIFDSMSNTWIAGDLGLAEYDGLKWTVYDSSNSSLPHLGANSIAIDKYGAKWLGTFSGLAKFDGTNWSIFSKENSGLPDNHVRSVAIDSKGNKWLGSNVAGIFVYREGGVILGVNDNQIIKSNLLSNYPSPFSSSTTINFSLPSPSIVTLKIFDVLGNEVATVIQNEMKTEGDYSVPFDGSGLPNGIYFYQLQTSDNIETTQMVIVR